MEAMKESVLIVDNYSTSLVNTTTKNTKTFTSIYSTFNDIIFHQKLGHFVTAVSCKAIVFVTYGHEIRSSKDAYIFRMKCEELCRQQKAFCYFLSVQDMHTLATIFNVKPIMENGEDLFILKTRSNGAPPQGVFVTKERDCYRICEAVTSSAPIGSIKWIKEMLSGDPKKVIIVIQHQYQDSPEIQKIIKTFEKYNPALFTIKESEMVAIFNNAVVDKVLHVMGEKDISYNVIFPSLTNYSIKIGQNTIKTIANSYPPLEQVFEVKRIEKKSIRLYFAFPFNNTPELMEEIQMSAFKTKKLRIILKININSLYEFDIQPVEEKTVKTPPNHRNLQVEEKQKSGSSKVDPVVVESQIEIIKASSVCNLQVEGNQESGKLKMKFGKDIFSVFLDNKNLTDDDGLDKTPLFFHVPMIDDKKMIIGNAAKKVFESYPNSVVYDIIKVASISSVDEIDTSWKFSVLKERDDEIFVEMKLLNEERNVKCPIPLILAFFLKNAYQRLKKHGGTKQKEIEIIFFDDIVPNEILKKNFVEAGKLYKNIQIVFV